MELERIGIPVVRHASLQRNRAVKESQYSYQKKQGKNQRPRAGNRHIREALGFNKWYCSGYCAL